MKKVRVVKELPYVMKDVGYPLDEVNDLTAFYNKEQIQYFIKYGWLEEVKEPQNIVRVVQDAYKYQTEFGVVELGDELARKIATAAMKYASEVASKAVVAKYQALHPQAVLIIETLLKEAEGI